MSKVSTLIIVFWLTLFSLVNPAQAQETLSETTLTEAPAADAISETLPEDARFRQPYLELSPKGRAEFLKRRAQIITLVSRMAGKTGTVASVGYATHRVRRVVWARKGQPEQWNSLRDYQEHVREDVVRMVDEGLWLSARKLVDSDHMNVAVGPRFGLAIQLGPLKFGRFITLGIHYQRDLKGRAIVAASFFFELEKYKEAMLQLKGVKLFGRELKGLGIVLNPSLGFRTQGEFRVNETNSRRVEGAYTYTPAPIFVTTSEKSAGAGLTVVGVPFIPPPFGALMPYRSDFVRWIFPFRSLKCVDLFAP
ncbi:MAG: hypothetical protein V4760_13585 [Bdellovibrionota bacterium]